MVGAQSTHSLVVAKVVVSVSRLSTLIPTPESATERQMPAGHVSSDTRTLQAVSATLQASKALSSSSFVAMNSADSCENPVSSMCENKNPRDDAIAIVSHVNK